MPLSNRLFTQAAAYARVHSTPFPSTVRTSLIVASVNVPVLSVHSMSMAPRSWIAERRFTITRRFESCRADRASVTVTIIGSSSGVSPTANATANMTDSSTDRWNDRFTTSTNNTMNTVKRMISIPKRRIPTANAVAGGFSERLVAKCPSAVSAPVRHTSTTAVPLMIEVPANTALEAPVGLSAPDAVSLTSFSAGYGSPVSSAWLT